jgi:aminopeptidase N
VTVIGAADFAVSLSGMIDGCIPVYSWVYPENRNEGFYDYAQAATILPFYIKYVGPYGYKKLANVQSKTRFGGLENANTIFYAENSVTGTRKSETLLAHEIAHQWFGNMATEKTFAHLWLSEGFATYMTILYMESKYGIDTARAMLKEDRVQAAEFARNTDRPVVDDTSDYMQLLNANSYQKGGWILHMLRRQLGDTIFQKSVRTYYATYAGKNADSKDLETVFEKVSGKDLTVFFRQWLYTGGIPRLDIKWRSVGTKLTLEIKQLQKSPFQFPLEINAVTVSGKSVTQTINITAATQTFSLPVKEKISSVQLDPKVSLLFEGAVSEQK